MQICALDSTASLVFAEYANKHYDYQCVECRQTIRLRRGIHRKAHFYHVQPNRICRQHAKGMPHLMLQQFLKNILPDGEVELECQFAAIGRIADVAWHPQRLVYEIQCSPISAEEVRGRNENYASIGYRVVWIFHDERYNKYRLSAAEDFLRDQPHYFSDMNEKGEGKIYDQFSIIVDGKRVQRLSVLSIDPSTPKFFNEDWQKIHKRLPFVLHRRARSWPLAFSGDTIDSCLNWEEGLLNQEEGQRMLILQLEDLSLEDSKNSLFRSLKNNKYLFDQWIVRPYFSLMKFILERASR